MVGTETLKWVEVTLHGEYKNNIAKNVYFGVFEILTNQNAKTHAKPPLWWINRRINKYFQCFWACCIQKHENGCKVPLMGKEKKKKEKTCIMNVFQFLRYQNAKTHEQHFVWRYIVSAFHIIRCQNVKINTKPLIWGNETILQKRKKKYLLSIFFFLCMLGTKTINNIEVTLYGNPKLIYYKRVFFSVLRRKSLKRMQSNQYEKIEKHYEKGIFWVFLSFLPRKTWKWMQSILY